MSKSIALLLIPLLPLAAALVSYLLGRFKPVVSAWLGIASLIGSVALAVQLMRLGGEAAWSTHWFNLPAFDPSGRQSAFIEWPIDIALSAATIQLLFILTTGLIGAGVLLYSLRDRHGDSRAGKFFATLTLFTGSMLLFLVADTLLVIYISWELMGVCSFLLIAHKGTKEAVRAAKQAFWSTRATDFGLLFASFILMFRYGWQAISDINIQRMLIDVGRQAEASGVAPEDITSVLQSEYAWLGTAAILVLLAVMGKSALLPLSFWLSDAMVAPAPVSALLHAATMVAAGPFLLIQLHGLFSASETVLVMLVILGGVTLLIGALMALCAQDPKRILAYSTISHLGLVVMAVGVLAEEAGYIHLVAHAWFKAALFIAVGYLVSVQLTNNISTDANPVLRNLAGAARKQPVVHWTLILAGLSLAGAWGLGGYFGKEDILAALLTRGAAEPQAGVVLAQIFPAAASSWQIGAVLMVISLVVTAAYITRLVGILCFANGGDAATSIHSGGAPKSELPAAATNGWVTSKIVMVLMALVGSVGLGALAGWLGSQLSNENIAWKNADDTGFPLPLVSMLLAAVGIGLAWYFVVAKPGAGLKFLKYKWFDNLRLVFANGLYLREIFQTLIGQTGELLAYIAAIADEGVVDWLANRAGRFGRLLAALCRWIDKHIVDGARYWACEIWWIIKRLHARTMQTGRIQRYMFVVVIAAVLLCLVIMKPLGETLTPLIETLMQEGVI